MDLQLHTVYVSLREKFKKHRFHGGIGSERVPLTAALYSLKGEPTVFFATLHSKKFWNAKINICTLHGGHLQICFLEFAF
jgi:hypothetical protein